MQLRLVQHKQQASHRSGSSIDRPNLPQPPQPHPRRVADLFQSVQLNVNNPHFLIMQGRVTKVRP